MAESDLAKVAKEVEAAAKEASKLAAPDARERMMRMLAPDTEGNCAQKKKNGGRGPSRKQQVARAEARRSKLDKRRQMLAEQLNQLDMASDLR